MIALSNTIILYQFEISRCFLDRSNKKTESLLNSVHQAIHSETLISIKEEQRVPPFTMFSLQTSAQNGINPYFYMPTLYSSKSKKSENGIVG